MKPHLFAEHGLAGSLVILERRERGRKLLLEGDEVPVLELCGSVKVVVPLGLRDLDVHAVDLLLDGLDARHHALLVLPLLAQLPLP